MKRHTTLPAAAQNFIRELWTSRGILRAACHVRTDPRADEWHHWYWSPPREFPNVISARLLFAAILPAYFLLLPDLATAKTRVGEVESVQGTVRGQSPKGVGDEQTLRQGAALYTNDLVRTQELPSNSWLHFTIGP